MVSRSLTTGEIALATTVFGSNVINFQSVKIFNEKFSVFQPDNVAVSPNGNIYYANGSPGYSSDFSTSNIFQKSVFIHEMAHVLQSQNGANVLLEAGLEQLFSNNPYAYQLNAGQKFFELGLEQQAAAIQDAFLIDNGQSPFNNPNLTEADLNLLPDRITFDSGVLNLRDAYSATSNNLEIDRKCFAADTPITLANQTNTAIQNITVGTDVLSHDQYSNPVTGRVTKLLPNTTLEFYLLDNGTYVTPGHRFTRPEGSFLEIEHVLKGDGLIVEADGTVRQITGRLLQFDAEAGVVAADGGVVSSEVRGFLQTQVVYAQAATVGALALKHEPEAIGWRTYNFEVAVHRTYVAAGMRVHNDSLYLDETFSTFTDASGATIRVGQKTGQLSWESVTTVNGIDTVEGSVLAVGGEAIIVTRFQRDADGNLVTVTVTGSHVEWVCFLLTYGRFGSCHQSN